MEPEERLVDFIQPASWADALAVKAATPSALPVTGGTDVMVELNFDARRPETLLDLTRITELADWDTSTGTGTGSSTGTGADHTRIRLGAAVTYTRVIEELGEQLPGLAMAARTVGSPQIRNRGTVGGNLGAASPAGDCHPPLLAAGAEIEVASVRGTRTITAADFYTGVKRNALQPDELIRAIWIKPPAGPQQFSKIGTRNAMVIAVAAFSLALHPDERTIGTGIGSAAPTPRRAEQAERFLAAALDDAGLWDSRGDLPAAITQEFSRLVSRAAEPIDDVRGTAAYRLHALGVMAARTLTWAWHDYRQNG
jgi:CO/xanthine dehydrogenase FAD-binding subunit